MFIFVEHPRINRAFIRIMETEPLSALKNPLRTSLYILTYLGRSDIAYSLVLELRMYNVYNHNAYIYTSGFWPRVRVRALRAPVFLGSLARQTGAARPPAIAASLLPQKLKKNYCISRNKMLPFRPKLGLPVPRVYIFPLG